MAHKKRIDCCRSKPRCPDCPVLALAAQRKAKPKPKPSRKRGKR